MSLGAPAGSTRASAAPPTRAVRHPGLALLVLAAAQLMVVLDGTIVNIALPSIQTALKMSAENLAWVVNAYALAFGGLMLLGGRAGDLFGHRRLFRAGIVVFTLASLLGGLAPDSGLLVAARVVQGVGAAVAAPTALSLITNTFAEGRERNRAMGVYAAMAGLGSTVGLLLGGVLTEYLSWRWVLLVNIPIGAAVLFGTVVLPEAGRARGRLDVPGALTGTGGLLALVYAITRGGDKGWSDGVAIGFFAAAAVLLTAFLLVQTRSRNPMMPLGILSDRNRGGSYATMFLVGSSMFAMFYFLTLYTQDVLHYSAVKTGLAYLPFTVGFGAVAGASSKLVARIPPRLLAGPGMVVSAAGMVWMSTLTPHSSYTTGVLPASVVTAFGLGATFVPMTLSSVLGVSENESGTASALLNTAQQVGGALGLAVLTTLSTSVADHRLPNANAAYFAGLKTHDLALVARAVDAMTHGYTRALLAGAVILVAAAVVCVLSVTAGRQQTEEESRA